MREVMALTGVPPGFADRLVETAVDELEVVARAADGRWQVVDAAGKPVDKVPFLCVVAEQAHDGRTVRVGWSRLHAGAWSAGKSATLVPDAPDPSPEMEPEIEPVVFARRKAGVARALRWLRQAGGSDLPVWELQRAVANLFPARKVRELQDAARLLGETWLDQAPVDVQAERLATLWQRVLEIAGELGARTTFALREQVASEPEPLDFGRFAFGPDRIASLPTRPGVYLMRDARDRVVYVGKAKNLAARLPAYFKSPERLSERDRRIVQEIVDFEVVELGSELEALLVEQRLIGLYKPRLNTQIEVHPRSHWERVRGNYAVILPSARPGHAEVFLITRGGRVKQVRTQPGLPNRLELEGAVSALFFEAAQELGVSVEGEIAFSWLARVEPWEQVVLVDRCASAGSCVDEIASRVAELAGKARA